MWAARPSATGEFHETVCQRRGVEWLFDDANDAQRFEGCFIRDVDSSSEKDDFDTCGLRVGPQLLDYLETGTSRHHVVQQHQMRVVIDHRVTDIFWVLDGTDVMSAPLAQDHLEQIANDGVVVADDETHQSFTNRLRRAVSSAGENGLTM